MQPFQPTEIYVDARVVDLPWTQRVLKQLSHVPSQVIQDPDELKKPFPISEAKKKLFITQHSGELIRPCQGIGDYLCCNYMTLALVSNCHLECTYCILQDYLQNNPVMTVYANIEDIISRMEELVSSQPNKQFRVGTGELSDSLALDSLTHYSKYLVPFAARHPHFILELKTKSNQVENLLSLDHRERTLVSWSVNPQNFIEQEELKTASLQQRLEAAMQVSDAGYPVGFHFDPLLALPNWKEEYTNLVDQIAKLFHSRKIGWISLGSLRFTKDLKKIALQRFPKSKIYFGELYPMEDGKMRYFREIREELYTFVKSLIERKLPHAPHYLCMETYKVWDKIFDKTPQQNEELNHHLSKSFLVEN